MKSGVLQAILVFTTAPHVIVLVIDVAGDEIESFLGDDVGQKNRNSIWWAFGEYAGDDWNFSGYFPFLSGINPYIFDTGITYHKHSFLY